MALLGNTTVYGTLNTTLSLDVNSSGHFGNTLYIGSGAADEPVSVAMLYVKASSGKSYVVDFDTVNADGLAITSGGNVVIGSNDSPQYTLDVMGSGNFSSGVYSKSSPVITGNTTVTAIVNLSQSAYNAITPQTGIVYIIT
jgi:hypothetical protein